LCLTRTTAFRHRDSAAAEAAAAAVAARIGREAPVDITTRDLYDRIQFSDVDGGAGKQGWEVKYRGDEWDGEKLKVFVAPHSHNDPGWIRTVEEYYERQSRHILDTIVESLSKVVSFSPIRDLHLAPAALPSRVSTIIRNLLCCRIHAGSSYGRRCRTPIFSPRFPALRQSRATGSSARVAPIWFGGPPGKATPELAAASSPQSPPAESVERHGAPWVAQGGSSAVLTCCLLRERWVLWFRNVLLEVCPLAV
jgi:hypothetical protein